MTTAVKDIPKLEAIYPEESGIPEAFKLPAPVEQKEYLINGTLLRWEVCCILIYFFFLTAQNNNNNNNTRFINRDQWKR